MWKHTPAHPIPDMQPASLAEDARLVLLALIREAADRLDGNLPAPFDFIRTAPESPTVPASGFLPKGTRVRYGDHIGRTDVHSARKGEYYVIFDTDALWLRRDQFDVIADDE